MKKIISADLYKLISAYLTINIIYIMPMVYLIESDLATIPNVFYPGYIATMLFYYVFGFTYIHIALSLVLIFLLIRGRVYKKSKISFIIFLFLSIVDSLLNIYWIMNGHGWTIQ